MNKNLLGQQTNGDASDKKALRMLIHQHSSFSGPLPHPEILKRFDEVVPGSAERIIKMAEGQFAHRTELERKVIDSDISRSKWGQILGFLIAVIGLGVSLVAILYGKQWAGSIIGGATLASLVGVFMYGSRVRSQERERKADDKAHG